MSDVNFIDKLEEIVSFLAGSWKIDKLENSKYNYQFSITNKKGKRIRFRPRQGKVSVYPVWPEIKAVHNLANSYLYVTPRGRAREITINFSQHRDSKAIARDLEKRFINEYHALYEKCLVEKSEVIAQRERLSHVLDAFKYIDPTVCISNRCDSANINQGSHKQASGISEYRLTIRSNECKISMNYVSVDVALKIAALLKNEIG